MAKRLAVCLALLIACASAMAAAGEHPWENKRVYYIIERFDLLRERGYFIRSTGSYRKQPSIDTRIQKTTLIERDGQRFTQNSKVKTITSQDGAALYRQQQTLEGGLRRTETVSVDGTTATFETEGIEGKRTDSIEVPQGVLFDIGPEWILARQPRPGKVLSATVLDISGRKVATETVTIKERRPVESGDAKEVWIAVSELDGRPPVTMHFTSDGRLLRLETEGLVYRVVTREEFDQNNRADRPVSKAVTTIPIGHQIPAWDSFTWLKMQAEPAEDWRGLVRDNEYVTAIDIGYAMSLTLTRNAPRVDMTLQLPLDVPADIKPYLSESAKVTPQNKKIIAAAKAAITDRKTKKTEASALKAVSYLAGWVNETVRFAQRSSLHQQPVATLDKKAGDCTDHAQLFASLARSLGIPTRICQGLLVQSNDAVYHAWTEVWLGGVWIPVDTTVSRVGLPAGYLLTSRAGPDDEIRDEFAWTLQKGTLRLSMLAAGRETPNGTPVELIIGDRRSYAATENDWMANLYWGFALRLPPSWRGAVKLNAVEMFSPDGQANVKCEAMEGEYRAEKTDLDNNLANLKKNLDRFKVIDSRIVSFDPEGVTPALFIDFTCVSEGKALRCQQYLIPRRKRAFRLSFWAPAESFDQYKSGFDSILSTIEF